MTGKYQAYSEYKDTGFEWVGKIPIDWAALPLKFVTLSKVKDGPHETPKFIDDGVPFFSVDGIQNHQLVFEGCRFISSEDHERFALKCRPKKGDVLLGKAASVGKVAYVDTDKEFNVWSPLAVITPESEETGRFIFYSLQSALLQAQCDVFSNSNTQKNLSMQTIDNLIFAFPSGKIANHIANFLDHETAKIDTLIEKQQQLIKLLKEKRQAVISHAVTKGLNPNAPMRDSGVEWLGDVPVGWGLKSLGWFSEIRRGSGYQNIAMNIEEAEETVSMLRISDIHTVDPVKIVKTNEVMRYTVAESDILVAGTGATAGISMIVKKKDHGLVHSYNSIKVRINSEKISSNFVQYFLCGNFISSLLDVSFSGSAQPFVDTDGLSKLKCLMPTYQEQLDIVSYLDGSLDKFEYLESKALSFINLLQERRSALISAAVTGKIDVRNWTAPEPSNTANNKEVAA
ncbi:MAG: restriction endonuclease subunit S [Porticoccaceae bacterium]